MKRSIFTLALTVLATGAVFTSCNSSAEKVEASAQKVEDAREDLDQAKQDYAIEYNNFRMESNEKLTANEKLIADLKAYSKNKKKAAKADYEKTVNDLEIKNQELKARVAAQKEENGKKWQSFKDEFNHDMNEVGESLNDLGKDNVK